MLKNAIDYLYAEWNNKAVGFVSYGAVGGARAAEHLRLVAGELQMADVRQQVALSLLTDFENFSVFKPGDYNVAALNTLLDQVVAWSTALAPLRELGDDGSIRASVYATGSCRPARAWAGLGPAESIDGYRSSATRCPDDEGAAGVTHRTDGQNPVQ